MPTHSSIPACEIPWTEEPGGLHSPWGRRRFRHVLLNKQKTVLSLPAPGTHKYLLHYSFIFHVYVNSSSRVQIFYVLLANFIFLHKVIQFSQDY